MTPLNSILGNSNLVRDQIQQSLAGLMKKVENLLNLEELPNMIKGMHENITLISAVQQSGMVMYYYNMNQITRMKIRKNEFVQSLTASILPEH